jgi:CrcB protein
MRVALVGIGGMLGAIARYAAGGLVHRLYPGRFPLGTLLINIAGCFVLGLLATLATDRGVLSASLRMFLFIGVLGGFTTFSSFGYETMTLWQDGLWWPALLNVAASVILGLGAVWAGHAVARLV